LSDFPLKNQAIFRQNDPTGINGYRSAAETDLIVILPASSGAISGIAQISGTNRKFFRICTTQKAGENELI